MKQLTYLTTALFAAALAACTQDNVHMPEPEKVIVVVEKPVEATPQTPDNEPVAVVYTWGGSMTTTVPGMEVMFAPATSANSLVMKDRTDTPNGYATLELGEFAIVMPGGKSIQMGTMTMPEVQYTTYPDGTGMFRKEDFSVTAGRFPTEIYSVSGTFDTDGNVTMRMSFKPSAIPPQAGITEIINEFTGTIQQQPVAEGDNE